MTYPYWSFSSRYENSGTLCLHIGKAHSVQAIVQWEDDWTWEQKWEVIITTAADMLHECRSRYTDLLEVLMAEGIV